MKSVRIGLAAALVAVAVAAPAGAGGKKQVVEGTFLTSGKHTDGGCFAGLTRRTFVLSNGSVNGVTGYVFDVDKKTWNKKFKLEPTGGQGHVDVDVVFYTTLGTAAEQADPAAAPANFPFQNRSPDGETGTVPPSVTKAIVCSFADESKPPVAGAMFRFKYTAG